MKTNRMKFIATFLLIVMQVGLIAQKTLSANLQTGSQTASNQSICVYPNPMQGKSTISFLVKQTGNTQLDVYSIDGKKVISTSENLQKGRNSFQLSLPNGIYMIQVTGNGFSYSTKVINQTKNKTKPEVVFAGIDNTEIPVADDSQYPAGINSMGVPGGNGIYGQDFLGGKIAYLLKSSDPGYVAGKDRGIVMSKVDLSTSAIWGCQGTLIPNLDYSTWNTGCSNNNAIVTGCSTPSIAAALCQSYSSDGYGSWYLPSIDELLKIDQEMSNNFTYADYWSSTQINSNEVVTYNFSNNAQMYALKSESKRVRAVKTFSVDAPTLTTTGVTSITSTSAVCGVSITNDGGAPIILRGVCWSTSPNPTNRNGNLPNGNGTGIGTFSVSMTNLIPNTTYYVRAWAITIFGTTYSSQTAFTTPLVVGASYEGGIIAYILALGDPGYDINVPHGLIAAPSDQKNNADSQNSSMYWSVALDVCNNLVLNDKDDWRLPTKNELQKLYASRDLIGGFNTTNIPLYWSSTDDPSNTSYAMCIWFDSGQENPIYKTAYQERVRAVRSF